MILFFSLLSPAFSAVKQVRVIVDRAAIYIEASRASSRIDIVEKGTVLNLFQQKKVNDVWYYISFESRRYGSRISGFIHESSVEPVGDTTEAAPKVEEKKPEEKIQQAPVLEKPAPQTTLEKPPQVPPKAEPKEEVKAEPKPVARYEETVVLTSLPKPKKITFPRRGPAWQEFAWKPPLAAEPKEEPKMVPAEKKEIPTKTAETAPSKPVETSPEVKKEQPALIHPPAKKETPVEKKVEKPRETESKPAAGPPPPAAKTSPVKPPRYAPPGGKPGFITFGLGYGLSFGGAGACLQLNTRSGFAVHAGAGLYPTSLIYSETEWVENKAFFSVGLKYYIPLSSTFLYPYIDVQYGGLRVEAAQQVIGIWEYSYLFSQEQKSLYGPSFLAGTEIRLGRFGVNGALGLSYCLTNWEYLEKKVSLAFDASLIIYF